MPSIEQCDAGAGSVAALPSTLEIFDKFKPLSENGKDSDSEESFHLPLDDDDIESQSVVSNGRGKEIHNEETEDDILNKFETLPSGTPDHIDPSIEDSILNDAEDDEKSELKGNQDSNIKKNGYAVSNTEIKLTYSFKEYEDSGDGEFKSIYEIDANPLEAATIPEEQEELVEAVELMEVAEESDAPLAENDNAIEESVDTFEDCMEIEEEETNQDIVNIIEKLAEADEPMEDSDTRKECKSPCNEINSDENVLMTENSKVVQDEENIQKDIESLDDDVEMSEDMQIHDSQIQQENVQSPENNSAEVTSFQEPVDESTNITDEAVDDKVAGSTENDLNEEKQTVESSSPPDIDGEKGEPTEVQEALDDDLRSNEKIEIINDEKPNDATNEEERPVSEEITGAVDSNAIDNLEEQDNVVAEIENDECISNEVDEADKVSANEEANEDNIKSDVIQKELPENDNQKEDEEQQENEEQENEELENEAQENEEQENEELEGNEEQKNIKQQENETQQDSEKQQEKSDVEDVFKVPDGIPKDVRKEISHEDLPDGPDLCNEKSNDKSVDDEVDLLDISMVRETEEDDACAIADAIEDAMDADKETNASEKSDEEQGERLEMEVEGSDIDKDQESNDDNDNAAGFDDLDDDSRMDGEDSSNAEVPITATNKTIEVSEGSKDSVSDGDFKQAKDIDKVISSPAAEDVGMVDAASDHPTDSLGSEDMTGKSTASVELQPVVTEDNSKSDEASENCKEGAESAICISKDTAIVEDPEDSNSERRKSSLNKRSHSLSDTEELDVSAKKPKLLANTEVQKGTPEKKSAEKLEEKAPITEAESDIPKLQTLTSFAKFMQCRKLTAKLSRSDLEQFCIQKICESLMLKSSEGELHQMIRKHETTIDGLRKDLQQLNKQCKDLEIVNKKLVNEIRSQNVVKKPLVPLKITRSVGLQVRLNPGNEVPNQSRRRQPMATTPQKQVTSTTTNRAKASPSVTPTPTVVRQVLQASPQKSPLTTGQTTTTNATSPMLTQALQKRQSNVVAKRTTTTPVRKSTDPSKPGNSGVIDLTDEDDKLAQTKSPSVGNAAKVINKTATTPGIQTKTMAVNKMTHGGKTMGNQGKQVAKTVTVGANKGNALSQGIRLTPASVITSSANGSPQMVYVVPTITSNAGGQQKVAFVNFQPTNGVLSGTLNGSTMSVMPNKQGQTLTLKTVSNPLRLKHPALLPTPPRINLDPKLKPLLPKPILTIKKIDTGIILQWKMPYNLDLYESIASYQLYAYQETSAPPSTDMWRKVGDVKALALPMACTLTQFADKNKYYFAVRSVDVHKRIGAFSDPEEISL